MKLVSCLLWFNALRIASLSSSSSLGISPVIAIIIYLACISGSKSIVVFSSSLMNCSLVRKVASLKVYGVGKWKISTKSLIACFYIICFPLQKTSKSISSFFFLLVGLHTLSTRSATDWKFIPVMTETLFMKYFFSLGLLKSLNIFSNTFMTSLAGLFLMSLVKNSYTLSTSSCDSFTSSSPSIVINSFFCLSSITTVRRLAIYGSASISTLRCLCRMPCTISGIHLNISRSFTLLHTS